MRLGRGPLPAVWLAFAFHAPLVAAGLYRQGADVATHVFLADHYRRAWFSLWEPRWFGGFSVSSYPPLVHQLLALLSIPFGYDAAFAILLLATLIAFPVAVWRFAEIFVPPEAASAAAVAAVFLPGVALAEYAYGQLPTAVSLTITLLLVAECAHFVERGGLVALGLIAGLGASAFAAHHATPLLFMPPALLAALSTGLLGVGAATRALRRRRAFLAGATCLVAGAVVIAPFWLWASSGLHQAFIPHNTRSNFLVDFRAQSLFVWGEYGVLPALAVYGLWRRTDQRTIAVAVLGFFLGILGLGGTTALPALLFGPQWQWLTYDRFALWGAVALLPLAGVALNQLLAGRAALSRAVAMAAVLVLFAYSSANAVLAWTTSAGSRDVRPIAAYMNAGRTPWRYQTFGLGNDATALAYLTPAATIDGAYYSARRLPELTGSGIGSVDAALWWDPSGRVLRRVLARADFYSIRWAFVGEPRYDAYLAAAGFAPRGMLPGRIEVWENSGAPPLPASALEFGAPDLAGVLWGSLPLAFAILTLGFAVTSFRRKVREAVILEQQPTGVTSPSWSASLVAGGGWP
jgi:hypothetical protein